jgi:hypothetical protein
MRTAIETHLWSSQGFTVGYSPRYVAQSLCEAEALKLVGMLGAAPDVATIRVQITRERDGVTEGLTITR